MKRIVILLLLIIFISLLFILYNKITKENMCLCNGPQVERHCSDKQTSHEKYNRGNTELALQNPTGPLIMPYDVFPGSPNPSDKNYCSFTPL